jgi:hypothetical protein
VARTDLSKTINRRNYSVQDTVKTTDVIDWMRRDFSSHANDSHLDIETSSDGLVVVKIYTDINQYIIRAVIEDDKSFLAAYGQSRKPRAGEEKRRGQNLAIGPITEETWGRIKNDIISFELVMLRRFYQPA